MREGFRQAMAWLHTWAGLVFGWLLFAIFLTGTLSYFKAEITHWMQVEAPPKVADARVSLVEAQRYLNAHAAGASRWFIGLPDERDTTLTVMWQDPGKVGRGSFVSKVLDPQTGQELNVRDTRGGEFFYRFHFELEMGYPWGRWLATLAAFVMFVTLITGIITHKKIFKEFFTFRPRKGQRSWLDGHNAIGVLVLPFHLMITYSSLVIFMSMVMPASIMTAYSNDSRAFFSDLFPTFNATPASGQPGQLGSLASMYDTLRQQNPEGRLERVDVQNQGDAAARVVFVPHGGDRIAHLAGPSTTFDGVTGEVLAQNGRTSTPLLVGSGFYGLHMGHFAGPVLRWLYFLCGLGGTAMIGTGLVMWLSKRQLKHAKSDVKPFELKLVSWLNLSSMAGLICAMGMFFWANRLLPVGLEGRSGWEIRTFFLSWLAATVHAALRSGRSAWIEQLSFAAALFCGIPLLNALTTHHGLLVSVMSGDWRMAGFDLTCLGSGLFLAWSALKVRNHGLAAASAKPRAARNRVPAPTEAR